MLERDFPKGLWVRIGWIVVIIVVVIFGAIAGFGNLTRLIAVHVANAPLAVALTAFGMLMALVALGIQRHAGQAGETIGIGARTACERHMSDVAIAAVPLALAAFVAMNG